MLNIAICEDNPRSLDCLARSVDRLLLHNGIPGQVICKALSARELEECIQYKSANVYLLDVELNSSLTGYQIAENIRATDPRAYIVFITGHGEYIQKAFKVHAFDFMTKPISERDLEISLKRLYNNFLSLKEDASPHHYIEVRSYSNILRIKTNTIIYLEKQKFKTIIHAKQGDLSSNETLETFEDALPGDEFIRCHKSFIANKNYISEIRLKEKEIVFDTGHKCYIGGKFRKTLLASLEKEIHANCRLNPTKCR